MDGETQTAILVKVRHGLESDMVDARLRCESMEVRLALLNSVIAHTCAHQYIDDEIELSGLSPHLERITFCTICGMSPTSVEASRTSSSSYGLLPV
jgi:hypothetical protein